MDSEISNLVKKTDFASFPAVQENVGSKRRSSRLKHGSTSQGSDSDSTVETNKLLVHTSKSENRDPFEYAEDQKRLPTYQFNTSSELRALILKKPQAEEFRDGEDSLLTYERNSSSAKRFRTSDVKGEQDVLFDSFDDDDAKEYSIFQVPDDPTEFKIMCGAPIAG